MESVGNALSGIRRVLIRGQRRQWCDDETEGSLATNLGLFANNFVSMYVCHVHMQMCAYMLWSPGAPPTTPHYILAALM